MEIIRGKQSSLMSAFALAERLRGHESVHIDIGTGDGRFVRHVARNCPHHFVIGIDACRENLREGSRQVPSNALFVIANARALPHELRGLAAQITINFPWGSLLEGLLVDDRALMTGLDMIARADVRLELCLNAGALAENRFSLEQGAERAWDVLVANRFVVRSPILMTSHDLRSYPTTWAKRLAFGCDPRAVYLCGTRSPA